MMSVEVIDMTQFKVTAQHISEPIRVALAARNCEEATAKAISLEMAGYWRNVTIEPFSPKKMAVR